MKLRLTYANVVGTLALFIVLGGAAYAATSLPKNSVGPKQLKANAVTSEKVKDKSLKAADVAAGVIPAAGGGPEVKGEPGDKGDKGDPLDFGFLSNTHDLPGLSVADITIDAKAFGDFKAYRIDCTTVQLCTITIGGFTSTNAFNTYKAWYEEAQQGVPAATKSFSLNEYTGHEGIKLARFHVTEGKPIVMRTMNDRYEITFRSDFVQRVSVT